MAKIGGYVGKVLRGDLSTGRLWDEVLDESTRRKFLGGAGIGTRILYDEVAPGTEWDSPENRLIFVAGPLVGTVIPGSGNYCVTTKGPLVDGMVCTQSNGLFGARMKFAGYDAVILQGIAPKWSYLYIHDGVAELRDATHLLGKDTWETDDALVAEVGHKQAAVACIGQAGENLVRFAAIFNDKGHVAASGGAGAVMGSKRLKAIVVYGKKQIPLSDRDKVGTLSKAWFESNSAMPVPRVIGSVGTIGQFSFLAKMGALPVNNLTTSAFPEHAGFDGAAIRGGKYSMKARPCWACRLAHCHDLQIPEGKYEGTVVEEPELEGMAACSSLIGVTDPSTSIYINNLFDRLGIDIKEGGFTVSLAIECFEKGLLNTDRTEGLELRFGNADAAISLLNKIARRQGWLGNILAEGAKRAAKSIGGDSPKFAVHYGKGNAPHVHDARSMWSILFGQAVSDTSASQGAGEARVPDPNLSPEQARANAFNPRLVAAETAHWTSRGVFRDSVGCCSYLFCGSLDIIAETLSAATGWSLTAADCLEIGSRVLNLQRAFNLRHGKTVADDSISDRLGEAIPDGPLKGIAIGPHIESMKRVYYQTMGWDEETSRPLPETLRKLGLEDVIQDLWG